MKTLTLIRHAKSSWKDPNLTDFDRPLNKRGKGDAPLMGRRLAERKERPDIIVSSPATRAVETMKIIVEFLGIPEQEVVWDGRLYGAYAPDLLSVIQGFDDACGHVMLCGHNPGITDFCNLVMKEIVENIPTCGVVIVTFPVDSWRKVAPGSGKRVHFDYPKNFPD